MHVDSPNFKRRCFRNSCWRKTSFCLSP